MIVGGFQGTGFFITPERLVTAWHVLTDDDADALPETVQLDSGDRIETIAVELVAGDRDADWVVLAASKPESTTLVHVCRISIDTSTSRWSTWGFSNTHAEIGRPISGHVASSDAPRPSRRDATRMIDNVQLHCDEAAASSPQIVPGYSGAPVMIDDVVIGLVRELRGKAGVAIGGTIDATPISAVLAGLVAIGEPFDWLAELRAHHPSSLADLEVIAGVDARGRLLAREGDVELVLTSLEANEGAAIVVAPELIERLPQSHEIEQPGLRWRRTLRPREDVIACSSVVLLAIQLGIEDETLPPTGLFAEVRRRCATATDWRGCARPIAEFVDLRVGLRTSPSARPSGQTIVIEGRPGSGKSIFARQLEHRLNVGEHRWSGPALRISARACANRNLAQVLADTYPGQRDALAPLLADELLCSATWLLVDGLDELPLAERHRVIGEIAQWPGPRVVTTRHLPEALPVSSSVRVRLLDRSQAEQVMALEGAPGRLDELLPVLSGGWPVAPVHPEHQAIKGLIETPLGASMIAAAELHAFASRRELIEHIVDRQLAWSVARTGVDTDRDLTMLAAMTWHMLRCGRPTLQLTDVDWAQTQLGLADHVVDELEQLLDRGGFVQPVGPDTWEFSHRMFAEYLAARAAANGIVGWRELLAAVEDPSVSEVLLHLASFESHAGEVIAALACAEDRPLTDLELATRAVISAPVEKVEPLILFEALAKHAKLATWFPWERYSVEREFPGAVGKLDMIRWAVERHATALRPFAEALISACHPEVGQWLRGETPPREENEWGHHSPGDPWSLRHDFAEFVLETLEPDRPVHVSLRFTSQVDRFRRRGRGVWVLELRSLMDHRDAKVRHAARSLWISCAPESEVVDRLADLDVEIGQRDEYLQIVASCGNEAQRREAILRTAIADMRFSYRNDRDRDPIWLRDLARKSTVRYSSERLLRLWPWAWRVGLLGHAHACEALERLYAELVDDAEPLARWRALRARREHRRGRDPGIVSLASAQLIEALADSDVFVRCEAIEQLRERGHHFDSELAPSLARVDDRERWIAWAAFVECGEAVDAHALLRASGLAFAPPPTPPPRESTENHWEPGPPAPQLPHFVSELDALARRRQLDLIRNLASRLAEFDVVELVDLLDDPRVSEGIRELLGKLPDPHKQALTDELIGSASAAKRRWAVRQLWLTSPPPKLMQRLLSDADDDVRGFAQNIARHIEYQERQRRDASIERRAPAIAPEDSGMLLGTWMIARAATSPDPQPELPALDLDTILAFDDFDRLWRALGEHPIDWKSYSDMDGFFSEEGVEFMGHFADLAAHENREMAATISMHLESLYDDSHRTQVIAALGHPLSGFWAARLLVHRTKMRDILVAFAHGERAATRAAHILAHTEIAPLATQVMLRALIEGRLCPTPPAETDHQFSRLRLQYFGHPEGGDPSWLRALFVLGGFEAVLDLAISAPDGYVRTAAEQSITHTLLLQTAVADAQRERAAIWARGLAISASLEQRCRALRILVRVGQRADARAWCERAQEFSPPDQELSAGFELLRAFRDPADDDLVLKQIDRIEVLDTLEDAFAVLASGPGDVALAGRLLGWLERPPPAEAASRFRGSHWRMEVARGIVRFGDAEQAMRLALLVRADSWGIRLVHEHGRLPEHVLLIAGALANAPQDSVIPASITGGGDEVVTSDVPEHANSAVRELIARTSKRDVRRALVCAAMLPGEQSLHIPILDDLGGPQPEDVDEIMARLEHDPADRLGLSFLARAGAGERELIQLWRQRSVPWWL